MVITLKKIQTKNKIIEEAEKQFIENGIANTHMKDIAESIGINRRTLYRYYTTKEELAFEIEMIVMEKIQNYLNEKIKDENDKNGFEKLCSYFENVNVFDIRDQLKFTAEFDRYFSDEYPNKELEKKFLESIEPTKEKLYQYIDEGIKDGSLRNDLDTEDIYHFISQNFISMFQRLILREKHLKREYCDNVDFQHLFKEIILSGIKAK